MKPCCGPSRVQDKAPTKESSTHETQSSDPRRQMIRIEAGSCLMGSESSEGFPADGEAPVREVWLSEYAIAPTCVTNAEFHDFVKATGYVTDAESYGWSFVFAGHLDDPGETIEGTVAEAPWWCAVRGASWRHPLGLGSEIGDAWDHPVVHVSWNDAVAYTQWSGTRLPTEAEWERAARGGLAQATYPWGDELLADGQYRANIWQGTFPEYNSAEDGYLATAPVTAFPPNDYGMYNVAGNVWEWTADWFSATWHIPAKDQIRRNPPGLPTGTDKVVKGGSYLCHSSYCNRYRVAARTHNTPDTSLAHTGFRVAA